MSKHVRLEHSRKKVAKAGDNLLWKDSLSDDIVNDAYGILSNWRSSHIYPMQKIQKILSKQAPKIDPQSIVVQRLKRSSSIINKLDRYQEMKLHRMQDIGGCRVILNKLENVYQLKSALEKNRSKHEIIKIDDYIENPKESGYRGIHMIFRYKGTTVFDYDKHLIEVQLRSKLQHAWATSVEIMGTFLNESLKTSQGSEIYLNAFKDISKILEYYEGVFHKDINEKDFEYSLFKLIKDNDLITQIVSKLASFNLGTTSISKTKDKGYYIMELSFLNGKINVNIKHYDNKDLEIATDYYLEKEKEDATNIVLVSAESLKNLKKAYPNYFADSALFVKTMNKIMQNLLKKFT